MFELLENLAQRHFWNSLFRFNREKRNRYEISLKSHENDWKDFGSFTITTFHSIPLSFGGFLTH